VRMNANAPGLSTSSRWGGRGDRRVLIYSHDTFGLGHLRRCTAIANTIADIDPRIDVSLLTGSPIATRFSYHPRIRLVALHPVTKDSDGTYAPLQRNATINETIAHRRRTILDAAAAIRPDLLIVDKEPRGLLGELDPTLDLLSRHGTTIVLGVRDVLDEPAKLNAEWRRKGVGRVLSTYYEQIWVYGVRDFWDVFYRIDVPHSLKQRTFYTGYIRRGTSLQRSPDLTKPAEVVVTVGGGGDGQAVIHSVITAYETNPTLPVHATVVFGPLMGLESRREFERRVAKLEQVTTITFHPRLEQLVAEADGVVTMGGYNTFCEILSTNQRAVVVPRRTPRLEQWIRARRAQEWGFVLCIEAEPPVDPTSLAKALRQLPLQPTPDAWRMAGFLDGLPTIAALTRSALGLVPATAIHSIGA
jgi:predicted glycosyltransferase